MVKSKVSWLVVALHIMLVGITGVLVWYIFPFVRNGSWMESVQNGIYFFITIIFGAFSLVSPFVNIKIIKIDDTALIYRYMLWQKKYIFTKINGYFLMDVPSRQGTYETIYPVSDNRILSPISSFYCDNYDEIKKALPVDNLGKIPFSWDNYKITVFSKRYDRIKRK